MASPARFVPVEQEPHHREQWRTDQLRLVHVELPPRFRCLYHQHTKYSIYICLTDVCILEALPSSDAPRELSKAQGQVFCRDHTQDSLIHACGSAQDDPIRIVLLELWQPPKLVNDLIALHQHHQVECMHHDTQSRVYKLTLTTANDSIGLTLPTNGMVVALTDCTVQWMNGEEEIMAISVGKERLVQSGCFRIQLQSDAVAEFILCEVY